LLKTNYKVFEKKRVKIFVRGFRGATPEYLVEKHSNSPDGFPWTLEANKESVYNYNRGTLPRSDDLMEKKYHYAGTFCNGPKRYR